MKLLKSYMCKMYVYALKTQSRKRVPGLSFEGVPGEKGTHFMIKIILGTVLICFLAFANRTRGCLRSGFVLYPNL